MYVGRYAYTYTHTHAIYIQFRKLGKWRIKTPHRIMVDAELLKIINCVQVQ